MSVAAAIPASGPQHLHYTDPMPQSEETLGTWLAERAARFPEKFYWFQSHGYVPHYFQWYWHSVAYEDGPRKGHLLRYRHLAAGRRGGKTMSAAWETVYYALHPAAWWWDVRGEKKSDELLIWVLVPKFASAGRPAVRNIEKVLKRVGLIAGKDYSYNKSDRIFTFPNGTQIEIRTAEQPDMNVGEGIHILWIDESAKIKDKEAWDYVRACLSDYRGICYTTTTPEGRNWHWDVFFDLPRKKLNENHAHVEYWSIHNPYFEEEEWKAAMEELHPAVFKREFMASFDAFDGISLPGDWLHCYEPADLPVDRDGRLALKVFIGVDPSPDPRPDTDAFSLAVIGVSKDNKEIYLLDLITTHDKPFPEQPDFIKEKVMEWRPEKVGIESNAFQKSLGDLTQFMFGFVNVDPIYTRTKKQDRIMNMSPLFKMGRVMVRESHFDFWEEWTRFDYSKAKNKDDSLDAVWMALHSAGFIIPEVGPPTQDVGGFERPKSFEELLRMPPSPTNTSDAYDETLGTIW